MVKTNEAYNKTSMLQKGIATAKKDKLGHRQKKKKKTMFHDSEFDIKEQIEGTFK